MITSSITKKCTATEYRVTNDELCKFSLKPSSCWTDSAKTITFVRYMHSKINFYETEIYAHHPLDPLVPVRLHGTVRADERPASGPGVVEIPEFGNDRTAGISRVEQKRRYY